MAWTISFTSFGRSGGRVIECRRTKEGYGNHEFNKGTAENLYNSLFLSLPLQRRSHRVEVDGRRRLLLNSCGGNVSSPLSLSLSLSSYDFYIALLLYSRKWKVRKKEDTRVGYEGAPFRVGPGQHAGRAPGPGWGQVGIYDSTPRNPER